MLWLYCSQPLHKFKTTVKPAALTLVVKCPQQARKRPSAFPQVFCACGVCRRGGGGGLRGMGSVPCCRLSCRSLVFLRVHLYTPQSSGTVAVTLPHAWASAGALGAKSASAAPLQESDQRPEEFRSLRCIHTHPGARVAGPPALQKRCSRACPPPCSLSRVWIRLDGSHTPGSCERAITLIDSVRLLPTAPCPWRGNWPNGA